MARILVGSIPVVGHINPLVPIVRALCARGHEVRWYTGAKYRSKVEATGARFVGRTHARDYDDAQIEREFPGRANLRGIAQLKFDMKHVFIDNAPGQLRDIQQLAQNFAPVCQRTSWPRAQSARTIGTRGLICPTTGMLPTRMRAMAKAIV